MCRILSAAALLVVISQVGGCAEPSRPAWMSWNPNRWADRSEVDDPVVIEVMGPVAVEVDSFAGDVIIHGNPKVSKASVTVMRVGVQGHGRVSEAKQSLDDISYTAEIVPGELGQKLLVRTSTTNPEPYYQRANVFIELPDVDGITVRTTNGKVYAQNISGEVDISTTEQDVRVMTNRPMSRKVTIVNRNGSIDYRVRSESSGIFDAQSVNGRVRHVVRHGELTVEMPTTNDTLHATLNGGANPIVLRTVNADIRIAVVSNPEDVGDFIVY